MGTRFAARRGRSAIRYTVVVRGTIGQPPAGLLGGMTVEAKGEESVLVGDVVDQAQLQGLIRWLSDLGIEIVSINPLPARPDDA